MLAKATESPHLCGDDRHFITASDPTERRFANGLWVTSGDDGKAEGWTSVSPAGGQADAGRGES